MVINSFLEEEREFLNRNGIKEEDLASKWSWLINYIEAAFLSILGPYFLTEPKLKLSKLDDLGFGGLKAAYKRLGYSITKLLRKYPITKENILNFLDEGSFNSSIRRAEEKIAELGDTAKRSRKIKLKNEGYNNNEDEFFRDMERELGELLLTREKVKTIILERKNSEGRMTWNYLELVEEVKRQGIIKTGIPAKLISPSNEIEWEKLHNQSSRVSQEKVKIKCGRCKKEFNITINDLVRFGRGFCKSRTCRIIGNFLIEIFHGISFKSLKRRVEEVSLKQTGVMGELIVPSNEVEYLYMRIKTRKPPSKYHIKVKCNKCGKIWCPTIISIDHFENWCGRCTDKRVHSFEGIEELVKKSGLYNTGEEGELLSSSKEEFLELANSYLPSEIPIKVKCGLCETEWESYPKYFVNYRFPCPQCSTNLYENICRFYFEKILSQILKTQIKMPTTPISSLYDNINEIDTSFFSNQEGLFDMLMRSHFDGYTVLTINKQEIIKLAFEYNGPQHYEFSPNIHTSMDEFNHQKDKDNIKKEIAEYFDISLIEFPYYEAPYMEDPEMIQNYILKCLKEIFEIDLKSIPLFNHHNKEFGLFFKSQKDSEKNKKI